MNFSVILLLLAAVILIGGYVWYASLITRRNDVREVTAEARDLRKRFDLLPNIVALAQKFA